MTIFTENQRKQLEKICKKASSTLQSMKPVYCNIKNHTENYDFNLDYMVTYLNCIYFLSIDMPIVFYKKTKFIDINGKIDDGGRNFVQYSCNEARIKTGSDFIKMFKTNPFECSCGFKTVIEKFAFHVQNFLNTNPPELITDKKDYENFALKLHNAIRSPKIYYKFASVLNDFCSKNDSKLDEEFIDKIVNNSGKTSANEQQQSNNLANISNECDSISQKVSSNKFSEQTETPFSKGIFGSNLQSKNRINNLGSESQGKQSGSNMITQDALSQFRHTSDGYENKIIAENFHPDKKMNKRKKIEEKNILQKNIAKDNSDTYILSFEYNDDRKAAYCKLKKSDKSFTSKVQLLADKEASIVTESFVLKIVLKK